MMRARLGAADNSFGRHTEQLAAARVNTEAARSRIEDVDVANEVAERTRNRILLDLQLTGLRQSAGSTSRTLDLLG
jgi:flagellin-like hook-associated protein FlgL